MSRPPGVSAAGKPHLLGRLPEKAVWGPGCGGEASQSLSAVGCGFYFYLFGPGKLFFIGDPPFPCGQHVIERVPTDARPGERGE